VSPEICVTHLVWAPLGSGPVRRFAQSYREHPAGTEHELLVVFKEFHDDVPPDVTGALSGLEYASHHMPGPAFDLAAYIAVAREVEADHFLFLNSNSEFLDSGWVAKLLAHLQAPGVGLVGASGSYESFATNAPWIARPVRSRQFPRFPNPHIRTNAFMISRELMLDLDWWDTRRKVQAWKLESGVRGITQQVWDRGLDALVVGRDGEAYPASRFFESNTFRRNHQANLLIADNRTREFDEADPERRRWLAELAWGKDAAKAAAGA
jgi:hypothetical protein